MSQIHVSQGFTISPERVRVAVDVLAAKLRDRFGAETKWIGDTLQFSGNGVEGQIAIQDNAVAVDADLGFMYGLMKGPIESEIRRVLAEQLA